MTDTTPTHRARDEQITSTLGPDDRSEIDRVREELAALQSAVKPLLERQAINDVLTRYARGLDRHDEDLEKSAFWQDAEVSYGVYSGQRDAFVEWGNALHARTYIQHEHHLTTRTIDIEGDVAHVESYVIFLLRKKDETAVVIGGARYLDKLERRAGEWRIALREFMPDIRFEALSSFAGEFEERMCPPSGGGRWDRTDLSYQRPLERRSAAPASDPQS